MKKTSRAGVSLSREFAEIIKQEFEKRKIELRTKGIYSISQFVTTIVSQYLKDNPPRFSIVNHDVNIVRVRDREMNVVADVEFKYPDKAFCPICMTSKCIHIIYALSQPDIVQALRKNGWMGEDYLE